MSRSVPLPLPSFWRRRVYVLGRGKFGIWPSLGLLGSRAELILAVSFARTLLAPAYLVCESAPSRLVKMTHNDRDERFLEDNRYFVSLFYLEKNSEGSLQIDVHRIAMILNLLSSFQQNIRIIPAKLIYQL